MSTAPNKEDLKFYEVAPIYKLLSKNREPNAILLLQYARDVEKRALLFECLSKFKRLDLFPKQYNTLEKLSISYLSNWLNMNDDYDCFPDQIEFCESFDWEGEKKILVYKFKSDAPHAFANRGWMFGYVWQKRDAHTDNKKPDFIYTDFSSEKLNNLSV